MGEFNVDKTTGNLIPTAGMPDSYPAEQVMMSDGTTSVEDAVSGYRVIKSVTADGTKSYKTLINELFANVTYADNPDILIKIDAAYLHLSVNNNALIHFYTVSSGTGNFTLFSLLYHKTNQSLSSYKDIVLANNGSYHDYSDTVPNSGLVMSILTR